MNLTKTFTSEYLSDVLKAIIKLETSAECSEIVSVEVKIDMDAADCLYYKAAVVYFQEQPARVPVPTYVIPGTEGCIDITGQVEVIPAEAPALARQVCAVRTEERGIVTKKSVVIADQFGGEWFFKITTPYEYNAYICKRGQEQGNGYDTLGQALCQATAEWFKPVIQLAAELLYPAGFVDKYLGANPCLNFPQLAEATTAPAAAAAPSVSEAYTTAMVEVATAAPVKRPTYTERLMAEAAAPAEKRAKLTQEERLSVFSYYVAFKESLLLNATQDVQDENFNAFCLFCERHNLNMPATMSALEALNFLPVLPF